MQIMKTSLYTLLQPLVTSSFLGPNILCNTAPSVSVVLLMPEAKLHIHREQNEKLQFFIYLALQMPQGKMRFLNQL